MTLAKVERSLPPSILPSLRRMKKKRIAKLTIETADIESAMLQHCVARIGGRQSLVVATSKAQAMELLRHASGIEVVVACDRLSDGSGLALLDEVARGVYELAPMLAEDIGAAQELVARYRDLDIGVADASLVVLADRHGSREILTLDERHFRAIRHPDGGSFQLLPADP